MNHNQVFVEGSIYHIRVKGKLDEQWAEWFEGFVMESRESGNTLLSGMVPDQAALHGVLDKLHSLGLPLLLVLRAECPCRKLNCVRHGKCGECATHYTDSKGMPFCLRLRTRWDRECTAFTEFK